MSTDTFSAAELLQHAQVDVTALLVLLTRHRDRLTTLERATVDAIAGRHGHAPTVGDVCTSVHVPRSAARLADPLAGLTPEQRAACEAELALLGRSR